MIKKTKAVVCMTTHDRVDCARINQEIIKLNYRNPFPIVHACSGQDYTKYLEDVLIQCEPNELAKGALNLLKKSVETAIDVFSPEYIIHIEGDTWIIDENVFFGLIEKMDKRKDLFLTTSAWDVDYLADATPRRFGIILYLMKIIAPMIRRLGIPFRVANRNSLSTQFFIIRTSKEMIQCIQNIQLDREHILENAFYDAFMMHFSNKNLLRLKTREPVHPKRRFVSESLMLFSQHWPAAGTIDFSPHMKNFLFIDPLAEGKKEVLQNHPTLREGFYIEKLLSSNSYDYYNHGAPRN